MNIRIKYFEGAKKLKKIAKGNWIDVYAREDTPIFRSIVSLVPLGFALELPKGWEAHIKVRSSTFSTFGIIQTNGVGLIDDSYIGDNDEWFMPFTYIAPVTNCGHTMVKKGDKIGQFRIMEVMPDIELIEVESFGNPDRGGHGSTGRK